MQHCLKTFLCTSTKSRLSQYKNHRLHYKTTSMTFNFITNSSYQLCLYVYYYKDISFVIGLICFWISKVDEFLFSYLTNMVISLKIKSHRVREITKINRCQACVFFCFQTTLKKNRICQNGACEIRRYFCKKVVWL